MADKGADRKAGRPPSAFYHKSYYAAYQGNAKQAFAESNPLYHLDGKTPIKTVRLVTNFNKATTHAIRKGQDRDYKFFKYGNNHHVEIIEHVETKKRKGIFVTAMEAARRARGASNTEITDIVQRDHGEEWRFVMSLAVNDMVQTDGTRTIYRVQKLDGSNNRFTLRLHSAATLDDKQTGFDKTPNLFEGKKILIDPLGNLTSCND